jgi:hypothetical protein
MDDIRPKVPAAPVRLFDQLRRHMCDSGYAWRTTLYPHLPGRRAMGALSPLAGE